MRWIDSSGTSFIRLESPIIILCSVFILCLCWRNPVSSKGFVLLKATVSPNGAPIFRNERSEFLNIYWICETSFANPAIAAK